MGEKENRMEADEIIESMGALSRRPFHAAWEVIYEYGAESSNILYNGRCAESDENH